MKLTDGKRTVEITMQEWNGEEWDLDWSADFFNAGKLADDETGASIVEDVDYCIEQAMDWKYSRGDYRIKKCVDPEDRLVKVTVLR